MQAIILAAGEGTRMRSAVPKVLHSVMGASILGHVLAAVRELEIHSPRIVVGKKAGQVRSFLERALPFHDFKPELVLQRVRRGTGHAVMMAEHSLQAFDGDVLVWPGDMPLLKRETLQDFIREHRASRAQASVLSSLQINPQGYGRILRAGGRFYAIREEIDASVKERAIQEVNTGVYVFNQKKLFPALRKLRPSNRKKELYLTDVVAVLAQENQAVQAFPLATSEEGYGVNTREDLAKVIRVMNRRELEYHMGQGVTVMSPEHTFIERGVRIGADTKIHPWCYLESGVKIGKRCDIGPFAKIRSGTVIGDDSVIGSFVEVTRSRIGKKVLAKHLTYLGDAVVGDRTNIGAGTITANFDGKRKHQTKIGKNNFIGSNTVLVAPTTLGANVKTGAGSVVTRGKKIKAGSVVVGVPARPLKSRREKTGNLSW